MLAQFDTKTQMYGHLYYTRPMTSRSLSEKTALYKAVSQVDHIDSLLAYLMLSSSATQRLTAAGYMTPAGYVTYVCGCFCFCLPAEQMITCLRQGVPNLDMHLDDSF